MTGTPPPPPHGGGAKEPSAAREVPEKKDPSKDRMKSEEREKDPFNRETWNGGPQKGGGLNSDKEPMTDMLMPEQMKQKIHDGCTTADTERGERRKERDGDVEPERPEKRSRCYEKESGDGYADPDGRREKDEEGFSYGVQQRKQMARLWESPQVGNQETPFRSRSWANEVSAVGYGVGKCMKVLVILWKEYESSQADKDCESSQACPTLEIRIPAHT